MRHLSADPIQSDCTKIVFLVRSQPDLMRFICSNVHDDVSKGLQREYHVYFVPRRTVVCEKVSFPWKWINLCWLEHSVFLFLSMRSRSWQCKWVVVCVQVLEDEKLHHMFTIGEYPLYLLPMDEDVLSFELDLSYKVCCVIPLLDLIYFWVFLVSFSVLFLAFMFLAFSICFG